MKLQNLRRFSNGPLSALEQKIKSREFVRDESQIKIMKTLDKLYNEIKYYRARQSMFSFRSSNTPKGIYIHGAVGVGKTTLMDLFHNSCDQIRKKRVNFNAFMTNVHSDIHTIEQSMPFEPIDNDRISKPFDPTLPVAEIIFIESWLICFDEFQVTDNADAMILEQLFTHLFRLGIVIVATSNHHPDDLYKNSLQRSNLLPLIRMLNLYCNIESLNSGIDYRHLAKKNANTGYYFVKSELDAMAELNKFFKILCSQENDTIRPRAITLTGRNLIFKRTCGRVLDSSFIELCERPLATSDFLQIAQLFHTVLIRDIPKMDFRDKSAVRRFINLIDTLYDKRTRVVISADQPLQNLFSKQSMDISNESHKLMDDLSINVNLKESSDNVFTGEEKNFIFDRTLSRLTEMQTKQYWQQWKKH